MVKFLAKGVILVYLCVFVCRCQYVCLYNIYVYVYLQMHVYTVRVFTYVCISGRVDIGKELQIRFVTYCTPSKFNYRTLSHSHFILTLIKYPRGNDTNYVTWLLPHNFHNIRKSIKLRESVYNKIINRLH